MKNLILRKEIIDELKTHINCEEFARVCLCKDFNKMYNNDFIDFVLCAIEKYLFGFENFTNDFSDNRIISNLLKIHSAYSKNKKILKKRIEDLKLLNMISLDNEIEKMNRETMFVFQKLNAFLNANKIEYYHTSGILVYLLTNTPLYRLHHDLDIMVDEKEFQKLLKCVGSSEFEVLMYLGERKDGSLRQVIKIKYKTKDVLVAIFLTEKKDDGSIYINDYFKKCNLVFVERDYSTPTCVKYSLSNTPYEYKGEKFYHMTLEALYNCKKTRRVKDIFDCKVMENFVDFKKEEIISKEIISEHIIEKVKEENMINHILSLKLLEK